MPIFRFAFLISAFAYFMPLSMVQGQINLYSGYEATRQYAIGDFIAVENVDSNVTYRVDGNPAGDVPPVGTPVTDTNYFTSLAEEAEEFEGPTTARPDDPTQAVQDSKPGEPVEPGGGTTIIDPLASGLLSSTNEAFIRQQYVDFFGRKADDAGINYYNEKFVNGYTKAELVNEFVFSKEFQEKIAPVSRLYLAYFLRIPDTAGLEYWINQKLNGWSLEVISSAFAESAEFNNRYGSLNNADFIRLVYQNIFNRSADVAGFNYYLNQLDSGNLSRGAMMTSISESTENIATSLSEVRIISFYYGMLRRTPEQGGYDFWVAALDAGTDPKTLLDDFIKSIEYQARF